MAHVSKSGNNNGRRVKPLTDEDMHEYFRLIKTKDMYRLLDLFMDDGVIYDRLAN